LLTRVWPFDFQGPVVVGGKGRHHDAGERSGVSGSSPGGPRVIRFELDGVS